MKKTFLVLLFSCAFLSCHKTEEPAPPATNSLKAFRWQKVQTQEFKFPLDTTQLIAYADTSLLTFDETQFTRSNQFTVVHAIYGSGRPQFQLQRHTITLKGDYRFQSVDSSLQLNYKTKTGGVPPWNIPTRDTVFQENYKVLKMNNEMLTMRLLPGPGSILPPLHLVDTFRAVPR